MNKQLALAIQLNNDYTFDNFYWENNLLIKEQLLASLHGKGERIIYLWGPSGSGKTHLLQACCLYADRFQSAIYLPMTILAQLTPEMLEGMANHSMICIDDIDAIARKAPWEEAIFHLYNHIHDNQPNTLLVITGKQAPHNGSIQLADLRSRLSWGLTMQMNELNDHDKIHSLELHAKNRGFELSPEVAKFLLNRCARNMHELQALLNNLDEASLRAQRKITIPFVKNILGI
ncbi:MAG: DnaA regulatory inactivator Hda [Legionella sp.]